MKIGFLGIGSWGWCLASLLASKGYKLVCWTTKDNLAKELTKTREHPLLPGNISKGDMTFTTNLDEALDGIDFLVESVTSAGFRPVLNQIVKKHALKCPFVITSKGIEQGSDKILSDVATEIFGEECRHLIGCLSGPSYASEVIRGLPTSVVASSYSPEITEAICELFHTEKFRVYPNSDIRGIAFGGALKNVIAIACGIAEGLGLGISSRSALITRGLHEMRKLACANGCKADTINGLAGLGDLVLTCSSMISRNYRFGYLLADGLSPEQAKEKIGMVVEGAYTAVSALELSEKQNIPLPVTEVVYAIIYRGLTPRDAVRMLMSREVKEEHL
jgi:glycerol-3-phosphate dehydrogenase (NAD(P)+)